MRSIYKASRLDLHGEWMKFLEGNLITRVYSSILGNLQLITQSTALEQERLQRAHPQIITSF